MLEFADDTKLLRKVGSYDSTIKLKDDLAKLVKWSMIFNFEKCKI